MTVRTVIMTGDLGILATFTEFVKAAQADLLTDNKKDEDFSQVAFDRGFAAATAVATQIDTQLGIDGIVYDEETVAGNHLIEGIAGALILLASYTNSELVDRENKVRNAQIGAGLPGNAGSGPLLV